MPTVPASPALTELMRDEGFAPQRAFSYRPETWKGWLEHLPGISDTIASLPPEIDRATVTKTVEREADKNIAGAFVASMIWGHGNSGYGAYRTARILTQSSQPKDASLDPAVLEKLHTSLDLARRKDSVEAYRHLNNEGRIPGLGPAFYTKWLYFAMASHSRSKEHAAPILDALIITWFANLKPEPLRLRPGHTVDYEIYVHTLATWGGWYGLSPADVEERIFRLIRDDGAATAPRGESDDELCLWCGKEVLPPREDGEQFCLEGHYQGESDSEFHDSPW